MCGVNGIFAYGAGAAAPDRARAAWRPREHMRARGPDGDGEWWSADRRAALGHRRLAIIDLDARAAQPMLQRRRRARPHLQRRDLQLPGAARGAGDAQGVRFRTTSDTEVMLKLYEREGAAMVSRLRGMFAFGLYDARKGGLLLGARPLWHQAALLFRGGRDRPVRLQVKAILAGGAVSREPDPAGIAGFHIFGYVPEPFTCYRAISSVPAGATLWMDAGGPGRQPRAFAGIAAALASGRRCAGGRSGRRPCARSRSTASDTTWSRTCEVGAFLSGGVDSGALLGLMRDAGQDPHPHPDAGFRRLRRRADGSSPLWRRNAPPATAPSHTTRRVGQAEFTDDLPAILAAMDQPSIDGVNTWFVAKATRELGLKVALSGLGGDELLAGYPSFRDVPRWRRRLSAARPRARRRRLGRRGDAGSSRPGWLATTPRRSAWCAMAAIGPAPTCCGGRCGCRRSWGR